MTSGKFDDKRNTFGPVKYGRDKKLEDEADEWLKRGVGDNHRSVARDIEKMRHEAAQVPLEDLRHYDPLDTWSSNDSVFAIAMDPHDVDAVESTICAGMDDGNVRARNAAMLERRALMWSVGDTDSWGSSNEDIPPLGDNGDRKSCTRCRRSKTLDLFSPDSRNRDGLRSRCKDCEKELSQLRYARKLT